MPYMGISSPPAASSSSIYPHFPFESMLKVDTKWTTDTTTEGTVAECAVPTTSSPPPQQMTVVSSSSSASSENSIQRTDPPRILMRALCVKRTRTDQVVPRVPHAMFEILGSSKGKGNKWRYSARRGTFKHWPYQLRDQIQSLCAAGFYYTGRGDSVRCVGCNGIEYNRWESGDVPWFEHKRLSPKCNFLLAAAPQSVQDLGGKEPVDMFDPSFYHTRVESMARYAPKFYGETPANLAYAGFVFTGGDWQDRSLICFACGLELGDKRDDRCKPLATHKLLRPKCAYIQMLSSQKCTRK